jgi:hypothetical protein
MPVCRWCRAPLKTQTERFSGLTFIADCIAPACVAARRQELGQRQYARTLSKLRPHGRVVRCLPGLCEAYGFTPPGATPLCRHCGTLLPEDSDHA